MNRITVLIFVMMAVLLAPSIISATPVVLYEQNWDGGVATWFGSDYGNNVDNLSVGPSTPPGQLEVTVSGPNSASYVRSGVATLPTDLTPAGGNPIYVSFNFITTGTKPSALALYFASNNDGHWWSLNLSLADVQPIDNQPYSTVWVSTGWNPLNGASASSFSADFSDMNWFGFYVQNTGAGGEIAYQFDNLWIGYDDQILEVPVPEPETVWMILAVALSLGMTFRGWLAELAGQVKGRFVKA